MDKGTRSKVLCRRAMGKNSQVRGAGSERTNGFLIRRHPRTGQAKTIAGGVGASGVVWGSEGSRMAELSEWTLIRYWYSVQVHIKETRLSWVLCRL